MLITLARRAAIGQLVAVVLLTCVASFGAISNSFVIITGGDYMNSTF